MCRVLPTKLWGVSIQTSYDVAQNLSKNAIGHNRSVASRRASSANLMHLK
jgi:hypothetical protein